MIKSKWTTLLKYSIWMVKLVENPNQCFEIAKFKGNNYSIIGKYQRNNRRNNATTS